MQVVKKLQKILRNGRHLFRLVVLAKLLCSNIALKRCTTTEIL